MRVQDLGLLLKRIAVMRREEYEQYRYGEHPNLERLEMEREREVRKAQRQAEGGLDVT